MYVCMYNLGEKKLIDLYYMGPICVIGQSIKSFMWPTCHVGLSGTHVGVHSSRWLFILLATFIFYFFQYLPGLVIRTYNTACLFRRNIFNQFQKKKKKILTKEKERVVETSSNLQTERGPEAIGVGSESGRKRDLLLKPPSLFLSLTHLWVISASLELGFT